MEVEMKMVKSLLLGTAAGLVAVAGAQAADMPVKGKPVQYVKICSGYGDGFYYLPGTDICIKWGGYVRAETAYWSNGGQTNTGNFSQAPNGWLTRSDGGDWFIRARAYMTQDTRQQTEYGVLRTYLYVGLSGDNNAAPNGNGVGGGTAFSANRAFVQFAGFTLGLAT